jgi:hypothetical protein
LGLGVFFDNIAGLPSGTVHYYRAYAVNSGGSDWADSTATFTTLGVLYEPVVTASGNTTVTCTTETLTGTITDLGNSTVTTVAFVWDTSCVGDPGNVTPAASGWTNNWSLAGSYGLESYTYTATISANSTYYWMAAVQNVWGWSYSATCGNFTTAVCPACTAPTSLTATLVDEYSVSLVWVSAAAGGIIIVRMGIGTCPESAVDGVFVYRGDGANTTYYIATDYIEDDLCFRAWEDCTTCADCGNFTYSSGYAEGSLTGGAGMSILGLGALLFIPIGIFAIAAAKRWAFLGMVAGLFLMGIAVYCGTQAAATGGGGVTGLYGIMGLAVGAFAFVCFASPLYIREEVKPEKEVFALKKDEKKSGRETWEERQKKWRESKGFKDKDKEGRRGGGGRA